MKVKELISELSKCNPENEAMMSTSETGSFSIVTVSEENDFVYLEGEY